MIILSKTMLSNEEQCPYLEDKNAAFTYFFARDLSKNELEHYLSRGWRKFGMYYFRPRCPDCNRCEPIRVPVQGFKPSKSQRRVINRGSSIEMRISDLNFSDEIYEVYADHSKKRFGKDTSIEEFHSTFFIESCPSLQSEYYLNGKLIAAGFLDYSSSALSSVYFVYNCDYSDLNLGTFSALKEIELAESMGLKYYYLGYYIKENRSMSYKNRFRPHEIMNWNTCTWSLKTT